MLENRAFDHMLGYLRKINPEINGLKGTEFNRFDPSNPASPAVQVSFDAPYQTVNDCGHTVEETEIEIWGSEQRVDPAKMNGFVLNEFRRAGKEAAEIVMKCFNSTTLPVLSTLAMEYTLFDSYYASLPGPTLPNRMYFLSGTSQGACQNQVGPEIKGFSQRTLMEDVYDSGLDFKIYYGDFPTTLMFDTMREFPGHFHLMSDFIDDCKSGTLPAFSFIEPRWFDFLEWKENSQHPGEIEFIRSGDVRYGEMLLKEIYEAVRASPQWNDTLLIVTYDEHGGLYDHVPPPQTGVPNPDGLNCTYFPFDFTRLGLRVPMILISPWVKKGVVVHEPSTTHYDHTSMIGTVRKLLNLKEQRPLTAREAWAATYEQYVLELEEPRTDCPEEILVAADSVEMWEHFKKIEATPETEENVAYFMKTGNYPEMFKRVSGLQEEIIYIAYSIAPDPETDPVSIATNHGGALFVRQQLKEFFKFKESQKD